MINRGCGPTNARTSNLFANAAKGGFGPVQHVAVSQLTHFVLGGIINSPGSSDAASVQGLLMDMDDQA